MAEPDQQTLVGHVLGGSYRIERLLGTGGMGAVYVASHLRIPRQFAVKILPPCLATDAALQARFEREAMIGSRLGHDHIVQVLDFNRTEQGQPYMVMELLHGRDLAALVGAEGALPLVRALRIVRQVAIALGDAHEAGVIHRDLKPENIFICPSATLGDHAKVLDFGLAKMVASQTRLTQATEVFGTPWYMSPEQAQGRTQEIDHRTDLFALGLVLYYALAARVPFPGPDVVATLYQVVHEEPESLHALRPDLPTEVVRIVERAIRKRPADRYPSARVLIQDIDAVLGGAGSASSVHPHPNDLTMPPLATITGPPARPARQDLATGPTVASGALSARPPAQPELAHAVAGARQSTLAASAGEHVGRAAPGVRRSRGRLLVALGGASGLALAALVVAFFAVGSGRAPTPLASTAATSAATAQPARPRGSEVNQHEAGRPDAGQFDVGHTAPALTSKTAPGPAAKSDVKKQKRQPKRKRRKLGEGVAED